MTEWDKLAPYYDLLFGKRTEDIPFWVAFAKQVGSEVLEFSCGTGRLTIPMAKAGVKIYGLDISQPMLKIFKKKLQKEPYSLQKSIKLHTGSAVNFSFPHKLFAGIFCPWGFPPVTIKEQDSLFKSVKKHLRPNGLFIIDMFNFRHPTKNWYLVEKHDYGHFPNQQLTITRQADIHGSLKTKVTNLLFHWHLKWDNGKHKTIITKRKEKAYTKEDITMLLKHYGFTIVNEYGTYQKTPWSPTLPRTIIVAKYI